METSVSSMQPFGSSFISNPAPPAVLTVPQDDAISDASSEEGRPRRSSSSSTQSGEQNGASDTPPKSNTPQSLPEAQTPPKALTTTSTDDAVPPPETVVTWVKRRLSFKGDPLQGQGQPSSLPRPEHNSQQVVDYETTAPSAAAAAIPGGQDGNNVGAAEESSGVITWVKRRLSFKGDPVSASSSSPSSYDTSPSLSTLPRPETTPYKHEEAERTACDGESATIEQSGSPPPSPSLSSAKSTPSRGDHL
jgi:hypothetical protein